MDECMDIVRGLTAGGYFEFHGEFYDIPAIKICPAPTEPIPLLVGGHADAALRRAVLRGDGWMHGGGQPDELDSLLARIAEIRAAEGVTDKPFEVHVISLDAYTLDGIKRLEDRGVTDVIVGFRLPYIVGPDTEPLEKKIEHLNRYADNVIAKVS
jgi:Luciferase-like monooxygenase